MLQRFQVIRNLGTFGSYAATDGSTDLGSVTLIDGENGKGKTTLTALLRSLSTGNPQVLTERTRFGAADPPHVVVHRNGGHPPARFENGAWTATVPDIVIFDDAFVDANVCSGLTVAPEHRRNLHEVILGKKGVDLARRVADLAGGIETARQLLRDLERNIPVPRRHSLPIEDFVKLSATEGLDAAILAAEGREKVVREADAVQKAPPVAPVALPQIDRTGLSLLLGRTLAGLEATAMDAVRLHLGTLGRDGEQWVSEGIELAGGHDTLAGKPCPFCARGMAGVDLVQHYRDYFGQAYEDHKSEIEEGLTEIADLLADANLVAAQEGLSTTEAGLRFWSAFAKPPGPPFDAGGLTAAWKAAHRALTSLLRAKRARPLEVASIDDEATRALDAFDALRAAATAFSGEVEVLNRRVAEIKEEAAAGDLATAAAEVNRLRATRERHALDLASHCDEYATTAAEKARLEFAKETAQADLERHRTEVMPAFQDLINTILGRFGAGFRLAQVKPENSRWGPGSSYHITIRGGSVPVSATEQPAGAPSFRTSLSSGDRSTLALAFFFANLARVEDLTSTVVVIDDPTSSLDESRKTQTAQEIRRLAARTKQVIVLSHSRTFIGELWRAFRTDCRTLRVRQAGDESVIEPLDMAELERTEYDRKYVAIRDYLASGGDPKAVALYLRPVLEGFLRHARSADFRSGHLLGPFLEKCRGAIRAGTPILTEPQIRELNDLNDYAGRFHHDTNPDCETALGHIDEGALKNYAGRTMRFASPAEPPAA